MTFEYDSTAGLAFNPATGGVPAFLTAPGGEQGRPVNCSGAGWADPVPAEPWRSAAARSSSNWSMRRLFGVWPSSSRIMRRIASSSRSSQSITVSQRVGFTSIPREVHVKLRISGRRGARLSATRLPIRSASDTVVPGSTQPSISTRNVRPVQRARA